MIETPPVLAHWTCTDGAAGIAASGDVLRPHFHPALNASVVWLTDIMVMADSADARALGLASHETSWVTCDRTEFRFDVATVGAPIVSWSVWARAHRLSLLVRDLLEGSPGAQPRRWWVSEQELPVTLAVGRA
jgi:hypothetical protein